MYWYPTHEHNFISVEINLGAALSHCASVATSRHGKQQERPDKQSVDSLLTGSILNISSELSSCSGEFACLSECVSGYVPVCIRMCVSVYVSVGTCACV